MCVCIYIYIIYIYIFIYIYICLYVCMYMYVCVCVCVQYAPYNAFKLTTTRMNDLLTLLTCIYLYFFLFICKLQQSPSKNCKIKNTSLSRHIQIWKMLEVDVYMFICK